MPLDSELELPLPLDGEEIKDAIAYKIAVAAREALDKHSKLFGKAYPKFRASVIIHFELDNFGQKIEGTVSGTVVEGVVGNEPTTLDIALEVPETPPNQLRRETELPVPTMVRIGTQVEEKRISYVPRNRRR